MNGTQPHAFEFGPYRLEVEERLLLRGADVIRLTPKAFETLALLVSRNGHLLTKEELIQYLWPDAHVEENNLAQHISLLRRTLEDGLEGSAYIETVPRIGYRFVAPVRELNGAGGIASAQTATGCAEPSLPEAIPTSVRKEVAADSRGIIPSWVWRWRWLLALPAAALVIGVWAAARSLPWRARPQVLGAVAVLPYRVALTDPQGPSVSLAFADDLIEKLAASAPGHALPITAVYRYLGAAIAPLTAGRELGADAVVSGEIQKGDANVFELTTRVDRVADGRELWSETRAVSTGQLADVEDIIAARVRQALAWKSAGAENIHAAGVNTSFEARQAYVMGRYLWNTRSGEGVFRSIALLERAVALAPENALFHAGLADALAFDLGSWPKAETQAQLALKLDSSLGEAHASLGFIRLFWERDRDAAEAEFKQAITLSPAYATAHQWYALSLAAHGDLGAAQAEIHEARQSDPFSLPILADECHIAYLARKFDRAQAACLEVIRSDPNFHAAHVTLLEVYEQTGNGPEALSEYFRIREITGRPSPILVSDEELRRSFEQAGLPGFWRAESLALEKHAASSLVPPLRIAQDYARLNNKAKALAWLDRLAATSDLDSIFVWFDPAFDSLHSEPRFNAFGTRVITPRRAAVSARTP
ncbi:MAG: winged helix-turn-helix domain-containing protein [Candidatus Acidiferrales bacterium]